MAALNVKTPPTLEKHKDYESWEKSQKLWQVVTDLKPGQQGPAVALALTGKAREVVLELKIEEIKADDGVDKICAKLKAIYQKDTVDSAMKLLRLLFILKGRKI